MKLSENTGRYSALCVLPEYQGQGIATAVMNMTEAMYPQFSCWELDTIAEEKGNCHLYEKMGFLRYGEAET